MVTRFRKHHRPAQAAVDALQPNHPTDDAAGIAATLLDGLLLYCAAATVIGINPATDNLTQVTGLLHLLDAVITNTASRPRPAC